MKSAAVDSGNKFWSIVSDKPIDQLNLKPAERELLSNCLIFEHSPYVKRVILACAPNLGSICVNNFIQNLAQRLISMPSQLRQLGTELATLNLGGTQSAAIKKLGGKVPTSVANMNPDNPFLLALRSLPLADDIKGDTIIGICTPGPSRTATTPSWPTRAPICAAWKRKTSFTADTARSPATRSPSMISAATLCFT